MANKLAGQKMKFTKARITYNSSDDEDVKAAAVRQMGEVLGWARDANVSEAEVTQGYEFPADARLASSQLIGNITDVDADRFAKEVEDAVDQSEAKWVGIGTQCVYAYGYRCAPGHLKVGRCEGDVLTRIRDQIWTSTPGKPVLALVSRTDDCRSLEKAVHGVLQVRRRKLLGGGDEWFQTDVTELLGIIEFCTGQTTVGCIEMSSAVPFARAATVS